MNSIKFLVGFCALPAVFLVTFRVLTWVKRASSNTMKMSQGGFSDKMFKKRQGVCAYTVQHEEWPLRCKAKKECMHIEHSWRYPGNYSKNE